MTRRGTLCARCVAGLLWAGLAGGVAVAQPAGPPVFTDVTDVAGIGLPDTLTESLAWGDYDNDGDQDLYLTNNGVNRLYRNDGGDVFTDVTAVAGVGNDRFSVGTAFADLDNDGDLDLYVVNFGAGADVLYRNDGPVGPGGEYVFTDVTVSAGTTNQGSSRGMAFLDYDRDGLTDIYVMGIGGNMLYHNLGSLQFEDVAAELGVDAPTTGVGVVCSDVDNNGWIDIFTGNRSGDINSLFLNDHGTFTDVTASGGIDKTGLGMGVLAFDYDNDLDMDLYWTTWPGGPGNVPNALYENIDGLNFTDVAAASGTEDADGWGISCNAGDVDNDGWQDFFVTNGFSAETTPNVLFHNQQNLTFADVTAALGGADFDGRGVAFADYDNDGDLDLCVTSSGQNYLWRNDSDNGHHWVMFNLVGVESNRSAIGARIEVTAGGVTTVQETSGGAGRGSFNSLPVEFGLGTAEMLDRVKIRWPNGQVEILGGLAPDQFHTLVEPEAGDINGDGCVDQADLGLLLSAWGAGNDGDIDGDGETGQADLGILLANWGAGCQ